MDTLNFHVTALRDSTKVAPTINFVHTLARVETRRRDMPLVSLGPSCDAALGLIRGAYGNCRRVLAYACQHCRS